MDEREEVTARPLKAFIFKNTKEEDATCPTTNRLQIALTVKSRRTAFFLVNSRRECVGPHNFRT